jgi:hypothetical protein
MALDLSTDPFPGGSADQKLAFAPLYQEMICTFIHGIKSSRHATEPILIYADPALWSSYKLGEVPCNLDHVYLWVRYRSTDGLTFENHMSAQEMSSLCLHAEPLANAPSSPAETAPPPSRCIFEQYTSYGGFAVFGVGTALDLDRFVGSEEDFEKIQIREP